MQDKKTDYTETLNLPKTSFPMRGNLPEREPHFLNRMQEQQIYNKILDKNRKSKKTFVLHDGPPYANGDIHMGHSLNKVLKDIIVRYKTMCGYYSPYVPGWDTHGLPIEKKVQIEKKVFKDDVGPVKFREICKDFAMNAVKTQTEQFKRLGGLGDYERNIYLTLDPDFEAEQIQVFWDMYKKGYIYRDLKPVYWCSDCETALAEAEIEYHDSKATSIFVKFKVQDDKGLFSSYGTLDNTYILIWTTTPWTLPGNQAITVNPEFKYAIVETMENKVSNRYIVAKDLVEKVMEEGAITSYNIVGEILGKELENIKCLKPLDTSKTSRVILGSDNDLVVSLDAGTGLVHTAPGHGHEDNLVCKRYGDIETIVPVDDKGYMTEEAGQFAGLEYSEANDKIIEYLKNKKLLFGKENITHSYPHCWRCKKPVIYRATTQWFASIEKFRDEVLKEVEKVEWIPSWGKERMTNMIKDRADWCISRQRVWGVPIPIFYCKKCGKELINEETIQRIKTLVRVNGSNMWYDLTSNQILQHRANCGCGNTEFDKESDTMDVWFDSGSTHSEILRNPKYEINQEVADMYLEGNDQYRGWFQSSLLTSVAVNGRAPYRQVLTHGMVLDGEGRKMSKSLGNGVDPLKVIEKYGADILRLWVVSADYQNDVRISDDILAQVSEVYKKLRNTIRFLLGNLDDFNINSDIVPYEKRDELDKYMMYKLNKLIQYVNEAYENYNFHLIYTELHRFCNIELSGKYLDVIKDRLYTFRKDHPLRRSSQSTMNDVLRVLVRLISPILCFTAEEIWSFMQHKNKDEFLSVMAGGMPTERNEYNDTKLIEKWDRIFALKEETAKYIEEVRANKTIGSSLDALLIIHTTGEELEFIKENSEYLKLVTIVSSIEIVDSKDRKIIVQKAYGDKCARCWTYSTYVGRHKTLADLCEKCVDNM